ncbi:MAG: DUF4783 domain-containing protein [Bacteroidales bacterium]|nr:DUF4783 domain-containing protein [Bacteroidales bacterium]
MKSTSLIVLVLIFANALSASLASAQESTTSMDEIKNAIVKGNAKELAIHFNTTIDLSVPGKDGTYSKVQAELIIKDFFEKNKPKSFKINHEGSSNDGSRYAIGTLTASNNSYRLYFLIKNTNGKALIHQMQIEVE